MPDPADRIVRAMGAVPTYEDLWSDPRPPLDELIAAIPAQLWLEFLSRLANVLAREDVNPETRLRLIFDLFSGPVVARLQTFLRRTPISFPIAPFPVLLLLELAAARATVGDPAPERPDFESMVKAIYVVWSHLTESTENNIRRDPAGIAAGLNERSLIGSPIGRMQTAYGCWIGNHPDVNEEVCQARSLFDSNLRHKYGVSLQEWVQGIALAYFISQNQTLEDATSKPIVIATTRLDLSDVGRTLIERCLLRVATTYSSFRAECQALDGSTDLLASPSLLPLKKYPCLRLHGDIPAYRVLSPIHLAEAALERPLIELSAEESSRSAARKEFGTIVEAFVHGVLRSHFGERYERLAPDPSRKRAEGVIWFPNGFIVVECKARRSSELIRYSAREDDDYYTELLRSGLRTAVEQIDITTADIIDGRIPHRCSVEPAVAGSFIVFLQDVPLSAISRSVLDRIIPISRTECGVMYLRPQLMTVEVLLRIDRWLHMNFLEILARKMNDPDVSLECLNNYLLHERHKPGEALLQSQLWRELLVSMRPLLAGT